MVQHSAEEVAAFLDGETRLIAAAWTANSTRPPFVLPDDEADKYRKLAKEQLRCVIRDCPSPALTTVHRPAGRDGFRHLVKGGHAPESFHHIQGKAVVAEWLQTRYPRSAITVEQGIDSQRSRIADVMIEAPTGERVAIEVQYSALTPGEWADRHRAYQDAKILDVWLFGHTGVHLRKARGEDFEGAFRLSPTHKAVRDAGLPLLWINPELGRIATAFTRKWAGGSLDVPADGKRAHLLFGDLNDAELRTDGIATPILRRLADGAAQLAEYAAAEEAREVERRAKIAAAEEASRAARRAHPALTTRQARIVALRRSLEARARQELEPAGEQAEAAEPRAPRAPRRCRRCGYPLDTIFTDTGIHDVCDPVWITKSRSWSSARRSG